MPMLNVLHVKLLSICSLALQSHTEAGHSMDPLLPPPTPIIKALLSKFMHNCSIIKANLHKIDILSTQACYILLQRIF